MTGTDEEDLAIRMSDPLDRATAQELLDTGNRVRLARKGNEPVQVRRADGAWPHTECADCGEDLQPHRLEMGAILCVPCKSAREHLEKLRRR